MSHTLKKLADGRWVRADGKPDEIVRDGEALRVSMLMLDGTAAAPELNVDHQRPRTVTMGAADTVALTVARHKYIERLNDGWKQQPAQSAAPQPVMSQSTFTVPSQVTIDGSPAYQAYKRRLEDSYRHAKSSHVAV